MSSVLAAAGCAAPSGGPNAEADLFVRGLLPLFQQLLPTTGALFAVDTSTKADSELQAEGGPACRMARTAVLRRLSVIAERAVIAMEGINDICDDWWRTNKEGDLHWFLRNGSPGFTGSKLAADTYRDLLKETRRWSAANVMLLHRMAVILFVRRVAASRMGDDQKRQLLGLLPDAAGPLVEEMMASPSRLTRAEVQLYAAVSAASNVTEGSKKVIRIPEWLTENARFPSSQDDEPDDPDCYRFEWAVMKPTNGSDDLDPFARALYGTELPAFVVANDAWVALRLRVKDPSNFFWETAGEVYCRNLVEDILNQDSWFCELVEVKPSGGCDCYENSFPASPFNYVRASKVRDFSFENTGVPLPEEIASQLDPNVSNKEIEIPDGRALTSLGLPPNLQLCPSVAGVR